MIVQFYRLLQNNSFEILVPFYIEDDLHFGYLFANFCPPRDSEMIFFGLESSCHLLLPVYPLKGRGVASL